MQAPYISHYKGSSRIVPPPLGPLPWAGGWGGGELNAKAWEVRYGLLFFSQKVSRGVLVFHTARPPLCLFHALWRWHLEAVGWRPTATYPLSPPHQALILLGIRQLHAIGEYGSAPTGW